MKIFAAWAATLIVAVMTSRAFAQDLLNAASGQDTPDTAASQDLTPPGPVTIPAQAKPESVAQVCIGRMIELR